MHEAGQPGSEYAVSHVRLLLAATHDLDAGGDLDKFAILDDGAGRRKWRRFWLVFRQSYRLRLDLGGQFGALLFEVGDVVGELAIATAFVATGERRLADAGEVFVVEGERDVETLEGLGLIATTNSGGAGKWPPDHAAHFDGKRVVIIPDADKPGQEHAEAVARVLHGTAASVRVVRLPEGVKDVSDFAATFSDTGELAERLSIMAEGAAVWTPKPATDATPEAGKPIVRPLAAFQVARDPTTDPLNLLGRRFLCRGGALLLVGPTGIGKSSLLQQIGITVALGRTLFGIKTAMRLSSLLIQAENDDGDVAEMRDGILVMLNTASAPGDG